MTRRYYAPNERRNQPGRGIKREITKFYNDEEPSTYCRAAEAKNVKLVEALHSAVGAILLAFTHGDLITSVNNDIIKDVWRIEVHMMAGILHKVQTGLFLHIG